MNHAFRTVSAVLTFAASSLLLGCPGEEPTCGQVDSFPAEGCAGTLDTVAREGVWHGLVKFDDSSSRQQLAYLSFTGDGGTPMVHGLPVADSDFDGRFFLASEYLSQNQRVRHAYFGCQAPDPKTVTGSYQVCLNGTVRGTGQFEIKRVGRPEGEGEASGLELVGEAPVLQGTARDLALHGDRLYLAANNGLVTIYDVSNPALPEPIANMAAPSSSLNEDWYDVEVFEDVLFVAGWPRGVRAYDLSTGSLIPPLLTEMPAASVSVRSLTVDHTTRRLLANTFGGEVLIFNINNPKSPVLIGSFVASNLASIQGAYPHASAILGDRLYGAFGPMGLVVASIAQPAAPTQLAEPFHPGTAYSNSLQMVQDEATVLAYEVTEGWGGHLRVVNVTTPSTASVVTSYQPRQHVSASQVVIDGTKAYLAYYQDGVRVLDISTPQAPTLSAYFDTHDDTRPGAGASFDEGAVGVRPAGDGSGLVYVADTKRGLLILRETP